jgi:tetratricopeptide (TPR) repeat protein
VKPNGVEALTGMAYCYVDLKQWGNAFGKFRSALAISPRYEPALRGIAEAYQQQGRKDLAIEAYQRLLEVYPKNSIALRQLERLGASPGAPPSGGGSAPAPPPTPAPGAGGGSG